MGFLKSVFGKKKERGYVAPEDFDYLFLSPEFVQKNMAYTMANLGSEKNEFLENLTQDDIDRYVAEGKKMKKKMDMDLGR